MPNDRTQSAYRIRLEAAEVARQRAHPEHLANGDEQRYAAACYPMSFTKGLAHNRDTGLVANTTDFEAFRTAIDNGFAEPFTTRVPVPRGDGHKRRAWEAPTAGVVYELEGPDPQAVTMPPAPALGSDELAFEMAEVYELALLRDVPFHNFDEDAGPDAPVVDGAVSDLNAMKYATGGFTGRARKTGDDGKLNRQTVFRGSSPGVELGPYVSQFLLVGNRDQSGTLAPEDGRIVFGAQTIDQRVLAATAGDDYMMAWTDWLKVQEGFYFEGAGQGFGDGLRRFVYTPRDLATYVHFDALYQAYLNACLILLGNGAPTDPAFDLLSGPMGDRLLVNPAKNKRVPFNAGGFALWGGPHILTLVTEVATRALKAVRYQKFNVHLRLRPEALAGRIEKADAIDFDYPATCKAFTKLRDSLGATLGKIRSYNASHDRGGVENALLPMAFEEGSPMHPTYGAGHATVAGACVTMLKAFFDTSAVFARVDGKAGFYSKRALAGADLVEYGGYESVDDGTRLAFKELDDPLTLEGELNKLAANISIGRNMAGVHYYSDYHDSVRMGERIALGILEEQALTYPTDKFVFSVPTFDGDVVRIGAR